MALLDDLFESLSREQRRRLLLQLLEHNPLDESKIYRGDDTSDEDESKRFRVQMYHIHLPKLAAYGFIDWDRNEHVIRKGSNFEKIRPMLELLYERRDALPVGRA